MLFRSWLKKGAVVLTTVRGQLITTAAVLKESSRRFPEHSQSSRRPATAFLPLALPHPKSSYLRLGQTFRCCSQAQAVLVAGRRYQLLPTCFAVMFLCLYDIIVSLRHHSGYLNNYSVDAHLPAISSPSDRQTSRTCRNGGDMPTFNRRFVLRWACNSTSAT